jgi:hypothetical protein
MEESALDDKVKAFPEVRSMGFWSGIWRTRIALATNRTCDKQERANQYISAEQYGYSLPPHPWLSMSVLATIQEFSNLETFYSAGPRLDIRFLSHPRVHQLKPRKYSWKTATINRLTGEAPKHRVLRLR